ncbi:hypothetical protein ENHAE0001_1023 [Enhydrobacter aerosaccus SK60]|nr:hypothetical protein ENHAE0001_1023 [Enhydrobacter aerosaccus SK60]
MCCSLSLPQYNNLSLGYYVNKGLSSQDIFSGLLRHHNGKSQLSRCKNVQ